jgi:hypothetical protein
VFLTPLGGLARPLTGEPLYTLPLGDRDLNSVWIPLTLDPLRGPGNISGNIRLSPQWEES